jgi:hypothetical protein
MRFFPNVLLFPSVYTRGVNGYQDLSSLRLGDRHSVNRKYFRAANGGHCEHRVRHRA